jgi:hypothetical protein
VCVCVCVCNQRKNGACGFLNRRSWMNVQVETQWQLGQCVGCGEAIRGGSVVETQAGKWHRDCFKCKSCCLALAGVQVRTAVTLLRRSSTPTKLSLARVR